MSNPKTLAISPEPQITYLFWDLYIEIIIRNPKKVGISPEPYITAEASSLSGLRRHGRWLPARQRKEVKRGLRFRF